MLVVLQLNCDLYETLSSAELLGLIQMFSPTMLNPPNGIIIDRTDSTLLSRPEST